MQSSSEAQQCISEMPRNHHHKVEGVMLKLKLQHFGELMRRTDSLEKTLMLGRWEEKGTTEDEMVA